MDRRDFLSSTARLMLVTSGLFITGKFMVACSNDDNNGGYYNGYYNGYYDDDDRQSNQNQNQNQDQNADKQK